MLLEKFRSNSKWNGFGLIGHEVLNTPKYEIITQAFDSAIKRLGLSRADAFLYANSRDARFLGDHLMNQTKLTPSLAVKIIIDNIESSLSRLKQEHSRE